MSTDDKKYVHLKVVDQVIFSIILISNKNGDVEFKVNITKSFGSVFSAFAKKRGVEEDTLRFHFNGERLNKNTIIAEVKNFQKKKKIKNFKSQQWRMEIK